MDLQLVAGNVRRLRARRGWTQAKLAKIAECSRKTIARVELGTAPNLTADILFAIADALHVGVDRLRDPSGWDD